MNSFLIKLFGFFLGLLIISIIISFIKVKESFTDSNIISIDKIGDYNDDDDMKHRIFKLKNFDISRFNFFLNNKKEKEEHNNNNDNDSSDDDDYENDKINIPYKGFKFICINTYKDINKLALRKGKWYDIDYDSNDDDDNDDKKCRKDKYFTFEKTIILRKNLLNNKIGAMGADISGIQLNGPDCYYFANNNKNYELTEFAMYMTIYINSCDKNSDNILFEMTGNTEQINNIYTTNIININLIKNSYDNYDIHLTIGNSTYDTIANNIDKNIIEKNNNLLIGLLYTNDKISLIINNNIYNDNNKNKLKITLGSKPLIINKDGNISMYLYNFVYYKSIYRKAKSLIRYNIFYLSGLHNKNCPVINNNTNDNNTNNDYIKLNKLNIPRVKFNYSDEYESTIVNNNNNKTCPFDISKYKIKFDDNALKPTIDRIKSNIETNIKDKVDTINNINSNIKDKVNDIKNVKSDLDRIKSDIETNIKDKTKLIENPFKEEEKQSFFKRLFNFF